MVRSQFEHCSVIWAPKLQREIDSFEKNTKMRDKVDIETRILFILKRSNLL